MPRQSLELPSQLPKTPAELDLGAKYFRVLSDPTRVRMRVADERVLEVLTLGRALPADNADQVATCRRVGSGSC